MNGIERIKNKKMKQGKSVEDLEPNMIFSRKNPNELREK